MNKHSIIRLITLFFILIFLLINGLFWLTQQHFSKQHEVEQIRRFLLADKLFHHNQNDFSVELEQLLIRHSAIPAKKILSEGKTIIELPFGKIIKFDSHTFFVNIPPPSDSHKEREFMPPPPHDIKQFTSFVLEDIQPHSLAIFWMVLVATDTLILLFFAYIIRKLLPLHRLKNAIIAFKEGDTNLDLPVSGKDEISQITHEFNCTLEKIASMREARSLFLRNILHELKTPIMKGSLTTDCLEPSVEQERLKRIFTRMDYLLNEFAKMERFSSGEWHLNLQEYRFVDILDHACDVLLCDKESIVVKGEESQLILNVDFELFTVALKNLIDNALKYSEGKPIVIIGVESIDIRTVGEALPIEKQNFNKLFNRAFENSSAGLGLGLYISDSIINKHNFRLLYHYADGYNCFSIVLDAV
ncbi:MAG: ArsS family sensor histidine kinase [Campylobacterales bacterium]|nr:ArsS family sensor histidine kinase [Campylobacterales bacterium]